ncbi:MAG: Asparagine--tRNA ligase [Bacteroidetes bacterium ADurb.Bin234]|jgi:asparaginyl-tRNA synthetase|nr:MAG: Asparagine--tRNA ligase [Bacteroidetes bacterium ADurb.Bin234]
MAKLRIYNILKETDTIGIGNQVKIQGWVRTRRGNNAVAFIALNDGSCIHNLQVVADLNHFDEAILKKVTTGACIEVNGKLVESMGKGQTVEIQAEQIKLLGEADPEKYPLQKKGHSMEFLREIPHLRPRTNYFGCVLRLRHAMAMAIHTYFNEKRFVYIHTPVITGADCEGAGEMFQVTTLDMHNPPRTPEGCVDYHRDFFGKFTSLTVSGQLNGEMCAMALGNIYTFGPTFRAENSNTPRHLAEFWMIEPEMAFYDINDNMDLAEDLIKYLIRYALDHNSDDLQFLNDMFDKELLQRLKSVLSDAFVRLSYTEAIEILMQSKQKFEFPVSWGVDLQSEHERYLVEKHFLKPVILTDYPKTIKAFYMKQNDDGKTVRAMDILFPKIGEIIGGSERESDLKKLEAFIEERQMDKEVLHYYIDTRRFGTAPHSGFGLGFERLMLFITGMANVRDVIPFPRTPQNAEC